MRTLLRGQGVSFISSAPCAKRLTDEPIFLIFRSRQNLIRSTLPTSHYYESAKYPVTGEWVFAKQVSLSLFGLIRY